MTIHTGYMLGIEKERICAKTVSETWRLLFKEDYNSSKREMMEYNLLCVKLIPSHMGKQGEERSAGLVSENGKGDGVKLETVREERGQR